MPHTKSSLQKHLKWYIVNQQHCILPNKIKITFSRNKLLSHKVKISQTITKSIAADIWRFAKMRPSLTVNISQSHLALWTRGPVPKLVCTETSHSVKGSSISDLILLVLFLFISLKTFEPTNHESILDVTKSYYLTKTSNFQS